MIVTVFRSRLAPGVQAEYGPLAGQLSQSVKSVAGYVSHKGFVAEDGERVTIVEFETEEALQQWRLHAGHLEAKRLGFTKFFSAFQYQICTVTRARTWESKAGAE